MEADMNTVAGFIDRALLGKDDAAALHVLREEVAAFCGRFPMPH
jgi:glycine/serine hydroxymethyltransferase